MRQGLFFCKAILICTSGVEYCPDLWRHYHYPDTFLPLDIVIQKYNQYTIVEPRIIGRSPFEAPQVGLSEVGLPDIYLCSIAVTAG